MGAMCVAEGRNATDDQDAISAKVHKTYSTSGVSIQLVIADVVDLECNFMIFPSRDTLPQEKHILAQHQVMPLKNGFQNIQTIQTHLSSLVPFGEQLRQSRNLLDQVFTSLISSLCKSNATKQIIIFDNIFRYQQPNSQEALLKAFVKVLFYEISEGIFNNQVETLSIVCDDLNTAQYLDGCVYDESEAYKSGKPKEDPFFRKKSFQEEMGSELETSRQSLLLKMNNSTKNEMSHVVDSVVSEQSFEEEESGEFYDEEY